MLDTCSVNINNNTYKAIIKSGSASSAFEKIKIEVLDDPIIVEQDVVNANQIEVDFRDEHWVFGYSNFKIKENKKFFEFEFEPKLIRRS